MTRHKDIQALLQASGIMDCDFSCVGLEGLKAQGWGLKAGVLSYRVLGGSWDLGRLGFNSGNYTYNYL